MSIRYVPILGVIECVSGVRVGGTRDELEIGGMDNPVVRDGATGQPYLPGSSLRGRMRALLEQNGPFPPQRNGEPHGCADPTCRLCNVFGPHKITNHARGPSRLIVRDAFLNQESVQRFQAEPDTVVESRTENMVDRQSNTAKHPRPMERVTRGTVFLLNMSVRVLERDQEADNLELVRQGLRLLEQDGIGGGISRGHGHICIRVEEPAGWNPL